MFRMNPSEQDIEGMLSNLAEAYKYDEQGKKAYHALDYRNAAQNYHRCMLSAKAVVQLTSTDLREMARAQIGLKPEGVSRKNEKVVAEPPAEEDSLDNSSAEKIQSTATRNRLDSTTRGQEIQNDAKELMTKCYNNLAACLLAREPNSKEDYMRAVFYCDNVLKDDPSNEKALFRKGVALMRAQKWEKAIEQFELCTNNAQAKLHINECYRNIEDDRRRRDAEIRANFAKARAVADEDHHDGPNIGNGHPNGHVPYH